MERSPSVKVLWHATFEPDDANLPYWEGATMLPPWAGIAGTGTQAVQNICEEFFDDDRWEEEFGLDELSVDVWVTVRSPAAIAGRYRVDLWRVTKARAERVKEATL